MDYLSKITARAFGSIPVARPISKWVYGFSGSENHYEYVQESKPNFQTTTNDTSTENFDKENDHPNSLVSSVDKDENSSKTDLSVENLKSTNIRDPSTGSKKKPDKYHSFGNVNNEENISKNTVVKDISSANSLATDFSKLPDDNRPSIDKKPVIKLRNKSLKTEILSVRNDKSRSGNISKNVTAEPLKVEGNSRNRVDEIKISGENISTGNPDISRSDEIIQPKFAANVISSTASATLSPLTTKPVIHPAVSNNISNSESGFSLDTYHAPLHMEREGTRFELFKAKNNPPSENGLSVNPKVSPEYQYPNSIPMNTTVSPIHIGFSQREDSDVRAFKATPNKGLLLNQLSLKSEYKHEGISDLQRVYPDTEDGNGKSFSRTNNITLRKKSYSITPMKDTPKNKEVSNIPYPLSLPVAEATDTHIKATEVKLPTSESVVLGTERPEINKFKDRLKDPHITIDDASFYPPKTDGDEISRGSVRGLTTSSDSILVERHLPLLPIFEQARPKSVPGRMPVAEPDSEEYNIHINIGTVEVQSEKSTESPYPLISDNPPGPQLSLDDYLELREGA